MPVLRISHFFNAGGNVTSLAVRSAEALIHFTRFTPEDNAADRHSREMLVSVAGGHLIVRVVDFYHTSSMSKDTCMKFYDDAMDVSVTVYRETFNITNTSDRTLSDILETYSGPKFGDSVYSLFYRYVVLPTVDGENDRLASFFPKWWTQMRKIVMGYRRDLIAQVQEV